MKFEKRGIIRPYSTAVKVADCYFDGQVSPNIEPIGWTMEQIKDFRKRVRKHNQLVNFGIDPELLRKSP